MPHSLVLNLIPQSPIYPNYLTGRHYHALFLNLVSSVDRTLGDLLHDSTADKAFTLSPLQVKSSYTSNGSGKRGHSSQKITLYNGNTKNLFLRVLPVGGASLY